MKERIEILVEIEIDAHGASEAEVVRIARHKLARTSDAGPFFSFQVVGTAPLTREQSRAVRLATAAAQNGGSSDDGRHGRGCAGDSRGSRWLVVRGGLC